MIGKQSAPPDEAAPTLRGRRYDLGFWGEAGGRGRPGRPAAKHRVDQSTLDDKSVTEQLRLDNMHNPEACRRLLADLSDESLRSILLRSRFNFGGSAKERKKNIEANAALDDRWSEEAADVFHVPVRQASAPGKRSYRKQADVVEDVVVAVQKARWLVRGAASDRDNFRRHQLFEAMVTEAGK